MKERERKQIRLILRRREENEAWDEQQIDAEAEIFPEKEGKRILFQHKVDGLNESDELILTSAEADLIRNGPVRTRMKFQLGKTTDLSYETPYGILPMRLYTERIECIESTKRIVVRLEYEISYE